MLTEKKQKIYNRIIFVGLLLLPVLLYLIPVDSLNDTHTICLFKNIFGVNCYGCGITRAVLSALHFRFAAAFEYNKLVVIVLPLFIYVWIKMIIKLWDRDLFFTIERNKNKH